MQAQMNRHRAFWALLSICAFFALGAEDDGCSTEEGGGGGSDSGKDEKSGGGGSAKTNGNCRITATDDCTPHLGPNGLVRVDALLWKITGAQKAVRLGEPSLGLREDADGMFIVVNLRVTSEKNESTTITDETIQLKAPSGNTYKADPDGTAIAQGRAPLLQEDIRPEETLHSKVVFDVPKSVANRKLEVRFGAGSTHGYIQLPTRHGRVAGQAPPAAPRGRGSGSYRGRYRGRLPPR